MDRLDVCDIRKEEVLDDLSSVNSYAPGIGLDHHGKTDGCIAVTMENGFVAVSNSFAEYIDPDACAAEDPLVGDDIFGAISALNGSPQFRECYKETCKGEEKSKCYKYRFIYIHKQNNNK